MLISLEGTLTQTRMRVGRQLSPQYSKIPMNSYFLYFQLLFSVNSASYFLEMIMLISLKGILIQIRMGVDSDLY